MEVEHGECALDEVRRGHGGSQSRQRGTQRFGLRAETAQPELAALVRQWAAVRRRAVCLEETGHEQQRDDRDAGAEVRQRELRQQGNGAAAGLTQVAAHADQSVEGGVDDGADVEAVRGERMFGLTLRTVGGAMLVRVVELFQVLLHRAGEWV